jgi:hypothetical protein
MAVGPEPGKTSQRSSHSNAEVTMAVDSEPGNKTSPRSGENLPVVVDMGRKPRKQIKQLREGRGKLLLQVNDVLAELRSAGSISATAQPVVVVVRQKPKNRAVLWPLV